MQLIDTFTLMKNILRIIFLLVGLGTQAQEGVIVPLETLSMDVQNGTYIKDTEGVFLPFEGTYIGHWDNKKFTLILQKFEHITNTAINGDYYYEDRMVGKYEIVNESNNSVLYSTMSASQYSEFPITNIGGVYNGELEFDFFDIPERCHNTMELRLYKMTTQGGVTTVRYWGRGGDYYSDPCPYANQASVPKVLPYGFLTLTKVN
jgi:hypothetical protein